ncbi:CLUMA_CG018861, isoform A [Clunio marinus]|uniref:CLUMA_CG018861, isoform A n=1 Tax=Clunio marinus TaxID=568069 RepID=A0A1J1J1L8_9DIPT|nr:CLUMA_CG018861, isoform A [Clunio marinus]
MFNLKEQRKRQIDTLKVFNDNVFEIINDEKYEIKFKSGQNHVTMIIELGPDFPYQKPKLSLEPSLSHIWLQNGEITQFPGLINFTVNSDLGRVCQAIIREFEKNPPEFNETAPTIPIINSSIPELNNLDTSQLLELLKDDQYLDDFVEELPPIKALNDELNSLIEDTEKLAQENLEKNSSLQQLKSNFMSISIDFLNLGNKYNLGSKKYDEKACEYSPENIRQLLEIAVSNAESEYEEIVESFLEGNQSLNEFLENFMRVKKLIALRKFKEERLNFQLNQLKL